MVHEAVVEVRFCNLCASHFHIYIRIRVQTRRLSYRQQTVLGCRDSKMQVSRIYTARTGRSLDPCLFFCVSCGGSLISIN